jgi:hypothetical protein
VVACRVAVVLDGRQPGAGGGSFIIGSKGKMIPHGESGYRLLGGAEDMKVEFPRSPGHFEEYAQAIKGGPAPGSNFVDYAGPLTEMVVAGNLAVWVAATGRGDQIEWDGPNVTVKNIARLERLVKPEDRKGDTL